MFPKSLKFETKYFICGQIYLLLDDDFDQKLSQQTCYMTTQGHMKRFIWRFYSSILSTISDVHFLFPLFNLITFILIGTTPSIYYFLHT